MSVTKMPPQVKDQELEELKEFLNLVLEEGEDVVSEWEYDFVGNILDRADNIRLSVKQREKLYQVKQKIVKEGLCEEEDYAQI